MTAHLNLSSACGGEPHADESTTPTELHWHLAADAVTGPLTQAGCVQAVAQAIADAEQRGADDVRFGSAYCPDCGVHCDAPHAPTCPFWGHAAALTHDVISANDGACVCGAEGGLFADPDPQCGVLAHRLAAQKGLPR